MKSLFVCLLLVGLAKSQYRQYETDYYESEEDNTLLELNLCPQSHPYAFDYGSKCCSEKISGTIQAWSAKYCHSDAIYCPEDSCEDNVEYNCRYCTYTYCHESRRIENLSPEYDGDYAPTDYSEGNRPVFEMNGRCIWWHYEYRHWWVGPCQNVGTNNGYAYVDEDITCFTSTETPVTWRRGGSNEIIYGVKVTGQAVASAGAAEVEIAAGTVGINAVSRNGRYRQLCRPIYINRSFRCA